VSEDKPENENNILDGSPIIPEKKRTGSYYAKNILIGFVIAIAYTLVLVVVFGEEEIKFDANEIIVPNLMNFEQDKILCDSWLQIGEELLEKNDNNINVQEWSETDRNRVLQVENLFKDNCVATVEDDLGRCTTIYITIQSLIDKMDERQLDSISEEEQVIYDKNYLDYFDSYCNRIVDDIKKTNQFMEFNMTRGQ